MSGKPNPQGVGDLRRALHDVMLYRRSIAELTAEIETTKLSLERNQNGLTDSLREVNRLLTEMDVDGPGNFGWEARYFELLLMLSNAA